MYLVYCELIEFILYSLILCFIWFGVMDVYKESINNDKCNEGGLLVYDKYYSYIK